MLQMQFTNDLVHVHSPSSATHDVRVPVAGHITLGIVSQKSTCRLRVATVAFLPILESVVWVAFTIAVILASMNMS